MSLSQTYFPAVKGQINAIRPLTAGKYLQMLIKINANSYAVCKFYINFSLLTLKLVYN